MSAGKDAFKNTGMNTQQEIFNNMTKGEWKAAPFINAAERINGSRIMADRSCVAVVHDTDLRWSGKGKYDAEVIVTAVNWWQDLMSKGINPELVPAAISKLEKLVEAIHNGEPVGEAFSGAKVILENIYLD